MQEDTAIYIVAWVVVCVIGTILLALRDDDKDFPITAGMLLIMILISPIFFPFLAAIIFFEKRKFKREDKLRKEKLRQKRAASQKAAIGRYEALVPKLKTQWKSYEKTGELPPKKFLIDAITLGKEACSIPKRNIKSNKKDVIDILMYARLSVYNTYEGGSITEGNKYAKSLGSYLKKLSK